MKKRLVIFISVLLLVYLLGTIVQFLTINKDVIPFIKDEKYPTVREVFKDDADADIIKVDHRIYKKLDDWRALTPDYDKGEEIGEIKKKTTNEWWFKDLYASKLEEGTIVYSGERYYRGGDAPFRVLVEIDGEIVFYEVILKE